MPLLADKTITVRNLHYDPETDAEEEISTTLVGVSVHARTVANASKSASLPGTPVQPHRAPVGRLPMQTTSTSRRPSGRPRRPPLRQVRGRCAPATTSR